MPELLRIQILNANQSFSLPRSPVSDDLLPVTQNMIKPGHHKLRVGSGYTLTTSQTPDGLFCTVFHHTRRVAAFAVADSLRAESVVWPPLSVMYQGLKETYPQVKAGFANPAKPDMLPWCAAMTMSATPAEHNWLDELQLTLAWAWIDRVK